jgi:iron(III) transport system substrate-binding protein
MSAILFGFLLWFGLLSPLANFCAVSLVSAAAAPEWEKTLAAARKEGKVVVAIPLGEAYPRVIAAFQKAYPDIKAEPFSIHTRDFMSRYRKEREVGQILWDALIGGPDSDIYGAGQQGYWDPVKPDLVLPEVLDNNKWRGGLDNAFSDKNKTFAFNYVRRTTEGFFINRDAVSDQELRDADGLWEPKWQGKIAWHDPREVGAGVNAGLLVMIKHGEKRLRDLWTQQKVAVVRDQRQLIEWTVRARQPVAAGLIERELKATFQANGVGLNVKPLPIPGIVSANPGSNSIVLVNKAPHPNARKVFMNWLLSQSGQAAVVQEVQENSLRTDVPVPEPERIPPEGKTIVNSQHEEMSSRRLLVNKIAREIFK